MSKTSSRLVLVIFLTYLAGVLYFLFLSLFQFPVRDVLMTYYWDWVIDNTIAQLISFAIPLQITAMVIGFSLVIRDTDTQAGRARSVSFPTLVRLPMVALLVLTLAYVFALEWGLPTETMNRDSYAYNTSLARELYASAQESLKRHEYSQAVGRLNQYLQLNPQDGKAVDLRAAAIVHAGSSTTTGNVPAAASAHGVAGAEIPEAVQGLSSSQLLERSTAYYQKADYFSAYYYASLALRLDPTLAGATRLQSRSLDGIQQLDVSKMDQKNAEIFRLKREGFLDLESDKPISAYYIYSNLELQAPNDPDVQRYLAASAAAVRQISFFTDEVGGIASLPGVQQLMFVNDRNDKYTELVYIGKLINATDGTYALNIELLRFSPRGEILLHVAAPYAKIVNQNLILRAIDRNDPANNVGPTVYAGKIPAATGPVFPLRVPVRELQAIAAGSGNFASAGLPILWSSLKVLGSYGYDTQPIYLELIMRLLLPFSFAVLSLFAISFGWRLRSRYFTRPPILALLLIPLVPFLVNYALRLYIYGFRIVLGYSLSATGPGITLAVLIASQGALLVLALLSLAGQSTD